MPYKSISAVVASANNVANPLTLTPVLPTRATGDLLLAITSSRSITATVATPAGWTIWPGFPKRSATASGGSIYVFYKAVVGGEGNPALTWTGLATGTTGDSSQACVVCLDGVEVESPSDVTPPNPTDASAAGPSIPTLTTATADALVVGVAMKVIDTATTGTVANSFTERGDFHTTSGTGHHLFVATRQMTTPAATGASAVTEAPTTAARCLAVAIAVKEHVPVTLFGALAQPITFGAVTAGDKPVPIAPFLYENTAEGGTDGTRVTAANSGGASGAPFSLTTPVAGVDPQPVFAADQRAHGSLAYKITQPATPAAGAWVRYDLTTGESRSYGRAYCRVDAYPPSDGNLVSYYDVGLAQMVLSIGLTPTGRIKIRHWSGSAYVTDLTGADTVPLNAWFRIEWDCLFGSSGSGSVSVSYFADPDGTMPTGTYPASALSMNTAVPDRVYFGFNFATEMGANSSVWYDDLAVSNVALPPITPTEPTTHFGALAMPVTFAAAVAGVASKPAVTHYGAVSVAASFGAATAGRRKTFAQVARPATFAATTAAQRRTTGVIGRPTAFGATSAARRQTFGASVQPVTFGAATAGVASKPAVTHYGATSLTASFGAATAGQRRAFGQVARPSTFAAVSAGQRKTFGVVARPGTFAATTAAQRRTFGIVARPSVVAVAVQARRTTFSGTAVPLLLGATTAGVRIAAGLYGTVSLPVSFGATTAGRRRTTSATVLPSTFGATTAGRRRTTSASALPVALTAVVAGRRRTTGTVLLPVTFGAVTAGRKVGLTGIVGVAMTLTQVTQGRRHTFGQVARPITFGEVTAARRRTFGQVARPVTFGEVTAGQRRAFGRVALALALTEVTAGQRRTFGQIALPILLTEVTAGRRQALGRVVLALVLQPAATGQRRTFGVVALPLTLDLFSHSRDQGVVLNLADVVYLGGRIVEEVGVGAEQVWPEG